MKRQIQKQARVFVAILFLVAGALGIAGYLLSKQRFYLPAWVPLVGTDFYEVEAELPTAQAVVPGQGQTVNIAGVRVGEVGQVELEDGRAVVQMQIRNKYAPIYRDATVLLRPKTGLKDMILALDPGTRSAGELPEGGRVRVANTLPDVNADQVLATLDADTRDYLRILLDAGGTALSDESGGPEGQTAPQDLRETFKRFEPTARDGRRFTRLLAQRRTNLRRVIHNYQELVTELGTKDTQLAGLVDSSNANFEAFALEEAALREALRLFPGALSQTETTLRDVNRLAAELGPALEGLRPFARELAPSLRRQRPFLRETTPIIRDQVRPFARDAQPHGPQPARRYRAPGAGDAAAHTHLQGAQRVLQHPGLRSAGERPVLPLLERVGRAPGHPALDRAGRSRADGPRNRAAHVQRLHDPRADRAGQPPARHAHRGWPTSRPERPVCPNNFSFRASVARGRAGDPPPGATP